MFIASLFITILCLVTCWLYVNEFAFWWFGGRGLFSSKNFGGGFVVAVVFGILHER